MALLPKNRTPVPSHRELHIILVSGFIIAALLVIIFAPRGGHENNAEPVGKEYYVKAQKDESWIEKFASDPVALFTLILTGATVGLYLATRSLFVATERLVIGADKSSERQLRAYVLTDLVTLTGFSSDTPQFKIIIKNYGQTPAYHVQVGLWCGLLDIPMINAPDQPERTPQPNGSFIGPGGSVHLFPPISKPITTSDRNALIAGQKAIFLTGIVYYRDAFKQERQTRFCFYRVPPGQMGHFYADGPMSSYDAWNYAD